jgi:hypothetical protein
MVPIVIILVKSGWIDFHLSELLALSQLQDVFAELCVPST